MHIERERGWGAKHLTLTKVTVGRRVILMHTRHALIISETYNHARSDTGVILQCWHEIPTVISLAHPGGCSGASRTHRHGPRPDPDSQHVIHTYLFQGVAIEHMRSLPMLLSVLAAYPGVDCQRRACVCHTRAPMQHEEKLNNGVFSLQYTLHSAASDSRQFIALVMSNHPIL
jgi:hypothetical protein